MATVNFHTEISKALQDPEMLQNLRSAGIAPTLMGPQELDAFMRAEYEKWGRVVRATGATVNLVSARTTFRGWARIPSLI